MNLKALIDQINIRNESDEPLFDPTQLTGLDSFLTSLEHIKYLGHGVSCVCFERNNEVVKCCKKGKHTIVQSKELFLSKINMLREHNMPILYPFDVIYDDDYWLVYTQPLCQPVDRKDISYKLCCTILNFVEIMLKTNIRLSDICYRNFGIHKNQIWLFDFHEIDTFHSQSNFLTNNLYSLFAFLGRNVGWHKVDKLPTRLNFSSYESDGTHQSFNMPESIPLLLRALNERDSIGAIGNLVTTRDYLCKEIPQRYNTYQSVVISSDGIVELSSHTLMKYGFVENLIRNKKIATVLDARCCVGGVGLKLAQNFPELKVHLNDEEVIELDKAKKIANDCMIYNTTFTNYQFPEIKGSYDLVLYYSLLHHILRNMKIDEVIATIRTQTNKHCIIEIPIVGDVLLGKVMKTATHVENYRCLASPETFRYHLVMGKMKVNKLIKINYGSDRLVRYAFVCSI